MPGDRAASMPAPSACRAELVCSIVMRAAPERSRRCTTAGMRCLVLVAVVGCTSTPPHWHVDGGALRDPDGRAAILRGVNLSGTQKMAPYLDGKTAADYARIRTDWGMNAIRFVMTWAAVEPSEGQYDDAYLDGGRRAARLGARCRARRGARHARGRLRRGFGFDGAPRWACDEARYAAFMPTEPWFFATLRSERRGVRRRAVHDAREAVRRRMAPRRREARAFAGGDRLRRAQRAGLGLVRRGRVRARSARAAVSRRRRAGPRCGARLGGVPRAELVAQRGLQHQAHRVRLRRRDVRAAFVRRERREGRRLRSGPPPADPRQRRATSPTRRRTSHAGLWIGEYGGVATSPGIVDYMTAQYDAAGAAAASTMYWAYDDGGYGFTNTDGSERQPLTDTLVRPYPGAGRRRSAELRVRRGDEDVHADVHAALAEGSRRGSSCRRASIRAASPWTAATAARRAMAMSS